jgi:branched-chain amino acid transport system permease protein
MSYRKKNFKSNMITYGLVAVFYIVCEVMLKTGHMSSLMQGLLVPLCYYMVLAVSLNLVVGISGELSLGHAGFMCIGAFTSAGFASTAGKGMGDVP